MKIRLVGSAVGVPDGRQNLTTYLVGEHVAIDAGGLGLVSPVERQKNIDHVFLSHSHIDHVATLPIFLDNVFVPGPRCPYIYASESVQECLQRDFFNERIWPDLTRISTEESAFFRNVALHAEQPVQVAGLTITPVPVDHVVPTFGFVIDDGTAAVVIVSDSGPTERIWQFANTLPHLRAVFVECSFPNALEWLAVKTKHLTPSLLERELQKLMRPAAVFAVHIKSGYYNTVESELRTAQLPHVRIAGADAEWDF